MWPGRSSGPWLLPVTPLSSFCCWSEHGSFKHIKPDVIGKAKGSVIVSPQHAPKHSASQSDLVGPLNEDVINVKGVLCRALIDSVSQISTIRT